MDAADFRRIARSLEGAQEGSHRGTPDFRVGGRIFDTLASQDAGYGNLMLTPDQQEVFVAEGPEAFVPWPLIGIRVSWLALQYRAISQSFLNLSGEFFFSAFLRISAPPR